MPRGRKAKVAELGTCDICEEETQVKEKQMRTGLSWKEGRTWVRQVRQGPVKVCANCFDYAKQEKGNGQFRSSQW